MHFKNSEVLMLSCWSEWPDGNWRAPPGFSSAKHVAVRLVKTKTSGPSPPIWDPSSVGGFVKSLWGDRQWVWNLLGNVIWEIQVCYFSKRCVVGQLEHCVCFWPLLAIPGPLVADVCQDLFCRVRKVFSHSSQIFIGPLIPLDPWCPPQIFRGLILNLEGDLVLWGGWEKKRNFFRSGKNQICSIFPMDSAALFPLSLPILY